MFVSESAEAMGEVKAIARMGTVSARESLERRGRKENWGNKSHLSMLQHAGDNDCENNGGDRGDEKN